MNSEKGESDKKLAELLNRIDGITIGKNLSEKEIANIKEKIAIYLPKCSRAAIETVSEEYSMYIP